MGRNRKGRGRRHQKHLPNDPYIDLNEYDEYMHYDGITDNHIYIYEYQFNYIKYKHDRFYVELSGPIYVLNYYTKNMYPDNPISIPIKNLIPSETYVEWSRSIGGYLSNKVNISFPFKQLQKFYKVFDTPLSPIVHVTIPSIDHLHSHLCTNPLFQLMDILLCKSEKNHIRRCCKNRDIVSIRKYRDRYMCVRPYVPFKLFGLMINTFIPFEILEIIMDHYWCTNVCDQFYRFKNEYNVIHEMHSIIITSHTTSPYQTQGTIKIVVTCYVNTIFSSNNLRYLCGLTRGIKVNPQPHLNSLYMNYITKINLSNFPTLKNLYFNCTMFASDIISVPNHPLKKLYIHRHFGNLPVFTNLKVLKLFNCRVPGILNLSLVEELYLHETSINTIKGPNLQCIYVTDESMLDMTTDAYNTTTSIAHNTSAAKIVIVQYEE